MSEKRDKFSLYDIALLQAYLLQVFEMEDRCRNSFKHTEWYLSEKYEESVRIEILDYLKSKGAACDCEVLSKINVTTDDNVSKKYIHK